MLRRAAARVWDVLVVGAGPAGGAAAITLASHGASLLLVDKASFPRWKVCGCCVNPSALATLARLGVEDPARSLGAVELRKLRLAAGGWRATLPLPGGVSLSREALDTELVRVAISRGTEFLPGTRAVLGETTGDVRLVRLQRGDETIEARARVVLAADGLGGRLLDDEPGMNTAAAPRSRMGCGVTLDRDSVANQYESGAIYMACGVGGYVGLVRFGDGRLDVAAALDPVLTRAAGGPGAAAEAILRSAGLPHIHNLASLDWRGTALLTRRRARLGGERLLAIGDAAGYVEPFTGEGIAWALASGEAAAGIVRRASAWSASQIDEWESVHHRLLGRRQRWCRAVTMVLRRARLATAAVAVLSTAPSLGRPLVRRIMAATA